MNRHEQHQQEKAKEREDEKKQQKAYEARHEGQRWPLHPAWVVVVGIVLTLVAVYVWTVRIW